MCAIGGDSEDVGEGLGETHGPPPGIEPLCPSPVENLGSALQEWTPPHGEKGKADNHALSSREVIQSIKWSQSLGSRSRSVVYYVYVGEDSLNLTKPQFSPSVVK